MKKRFFVLLSLALAIFTMQAAPVKNLPVKRVQPKGDTLYCFVSGDEFFHRLHDQNGYTIIQDVQTGWYVYAQAQDGLLVPTQYVAGTVDPATVGLTPGAMPGADYLASCHKAWQVPPQYAHAASKTSGRNHGTLHNIVIFIRFSDESTCTSVTMPQMDSKFNDSSATGQSLFSYLYYTSYNKLRCITHFYPATTGTTVLSFQDSHPRAYYQPYSATNTIGYQDDERTNREFTLLQNAVNWINANSPVPANLNIDMDNDGYVDNVCFVVSGSTDGWNDMLWPHKWSLYDRTVSINGKRVYTFNFQLAGSGDHYFGVSTLCHEMTHTLGAPDLYHYDNYTSVDPAGTWDLMCSNSTPPQQSNSLFKLKYLNWIDSIPTISDTGLYTLQSLGSGPNNAVKIASPNEHQWYILEYRNNADRFDCSIPNRGLLVWRYNDQANSNASFGDDSPHELWLFRPGSSDDFTNGTTTSSACFGVNGRNTFNATTNPHPYLCNGRIDTSFSLTDITVASNGQSVSFYFVPKGTSAPACGPVNTYPHQQDFEDGNLGCWTFVSNNTANAIGTTNGAGVCTGNSHGGSYAFRFSSYSSVGSSGGDYGQYLISPMLNHDDTLALTFFCRRYNENYPESLYVKYSTTTNDPSAFTQTLWSSTNLSAQYERVDLAIPPTAKYVAFYYYSSYQYYVFLDDISLIVPCGKVRRYPHVQDFETGDLGCWSFVSANIENAIGASSHAAEVNSEQQRNGLFCFRFSSYSQANSTSDFNQYLITPELVTNDPLTLQFYYKKTQNLTENIRVKYSTTTNDPTAFTQTLWTAPSVTTTYQQATVTIPANAKYVALNYESNYAYYVFVDDISLTSTNPEVHDTTYIIIHDTLTNWIHDTLTTWVHDTDTLRIHDTITTWIHDTLTHTLYDTITHWIHDTIYNRQQAAAAVIIPQPTLIHDTIYLRDTTWITLHDTIYRTLHDTSWVYLRDTTYRTLHDTLHLYLHDTIYITRHDTTYITVGILQPETEPFRLYLSGRSVIVSQLQGRPLRVFDMMGRLLYSERQPADECRFQLPAAGVYILQAGNAPARKIVVP